MAQSEMRLIDANDLQTYTLEFDAKNKAERQSMRIVFCKDIENAPTVDAIPIAVMESEIAGIQLADQCDQAGRHDLELRNALEIVLRWKKTPAYEAREKWWRNQHGKR